MRLAIKRIGEWGRAQKILGTASVLTGPALKQAIFEEAIQLQAQIKRNIQKGPPPPLSPATIAFKRFNRGAGAGSRPGRGGSKPLNATGGLKNSIAVVPEKPSDHIFVGVPKKGNRNKNQIDIAQIHEFGAPTIVIKKTPQMHRKLMAVFRRAGRLEPAGAGIPIIVIRIPARPYIRPAVEKRQQGMADRIVQRVTKLVRIAAG